MKRLSLLMLSLFIAMPFLQILEPVAMPAYAQEAPTQGSNAVQQIETGKIFVRMDNNETDALRAAVQPAAKTRNRSFSVAKSMKTEAMNAVPKLEAVADLLEDIQPILPSRAQQQSKTLLRSASRNAQTKQRNIDRWFTVTVGPQYIVDVENPDALGFPEGLVVVPGVDSVVTYNDGEEIRRQVIPSDVAASIQKTREAVQRLKAAGFEAVEISKVAKLDLVPNDPLYPQLWGMQRIEADRVWDITQGEDVIVAVMDTGIDFNHPDLIDNIWINPGEDLNGNGQVDPEERNNVDDDGNGYTDDFHGWDFYSNDNDPTDGYSHGSHVSGTIAATINNAEGVVGVAPRVKIMPLEIFSAGGGYAGDSNVVKAIEYAAANGAKVANHSWGGGGTNQMLADAFNAAAADHDFLSIAAAGNNYGDAADHFPANIDVVVAVGAIDQQDQRAGFSNSGPTVDIAAPGVNVLSTIPGGNYGYKSGTSMATPHAVGVAALVRSLHPEFTQSEVRSIMRTAVDTFNPDKSLGTGIINAFKAINTESPPPNALITDTPKKITGPFDIRGTATSPTFVEYIIEWSSSANPSQWNFLYRSTQSVENGLLASIDSSPLAEGNVNIRLRVINAEGQEGIDVATALVHNVEVLSPFNNDVYSKGDPVLVTAHIGIPYTSATLEYGEGRSPSVWIPISTQGGGTGFNGVLAQWDTSQVGQSTRSAGSFYSLRLRVDTTNGVKEDNVYMVHLDPALKTGWPRYVDNYGWIGHDNDVRTADLDGDGIKEIITVDAKRSEGSDYITTPMLRVFRADGSLFWERELPINGTLFPAPHIPVIGDLDGDGMLDVFVAASSPTTIHGFKGNGNKLNTEWPVELSSSYYGDALVIADFENDGSNELLVYNRKNYYLIDASGNAQNILNLGSNVNSLYLNRNGFPAVGNFDDDADLEIVGRYDNSRIVAFNIDGSILPGWPSASYGDNFFMSPAVADFNGDGYDEIVVNFTSLFSENDAGIVVLDRNAQPLPGWPTLTDKHFYNTPSIADMDNDGSLDIIAQSYIRSNNIHVLDINGSELPGWPQTSRAEGFFFGLEVADINGDSALDIVYTGGGMQSGIITSENTSTSTGLQAFNADGTVIDLYPESVSNSFLPERVVNAPAVIDDIDNDGKIDIVAVSIYDREYVPVGSADPERSKNRRSIYVWELNAPFNADAAPWPTWQHDNRHTGRYTALEAPDNKPIFTTDPTDHTVAEGETLAFALEGIDPDGEEIEYGLTLFDADRDLNNDGKLDRLDVQVVEDHFGARIGDPNYDPFADLNSDGVIDFADFTILRDSLIQLPENATFDTEAGEFSWTPDTEQVGTYTFTAFVVNVDQLSPLSSVNITIEVGEEPQPAAHIIDNGNTGYSDTGFKVFTRQGFASEEDGMTDMSYSEVAFVKKAYWTFTDLAPGEYRVSTSYPPAPNRSKKSPFFVYDGAANTTLLAEKHINQKLAPDDFSADGADWEDIAETITITGDTLTVKLTGGTGEAGVYVIADAVRIEQLSATEIVGPQVAVSHNGTDIPHGDPFSFGEVTLGSDGERTFTVTNTGDQPLTLEKGSLSVSGLFTVVNGLDTNVLAPGESEEFTIAINTSILDDKSGEVSFGNGDSAKDPFSFIVYGTVIEGEEEPAIRIIDNGNTGYSDTGYKVFARQGFASEEDGIHDINYSQTAFVKRAYWTFKDLTPGTYRVSTSYPPAPNRSKKSPFFVYDGAANTTLLAEKHINQKLAPDDFSADGADWEDIAETVTITGDTLTVKLTGGTGEGGKIYVIADAVRIEKVEDVATSNLFIQQDTIPVPTRQVLGGELSEDLLILELTADSDPIDVTGLGFSMDSESIDRLELFRGNSPVAFAHATQYECTGQNPLLDFCATMNLNELVVPAGSSDVVHVRASVKSDRIGGVKGSDASIVFHEFSAQAKNEITNVPLNLNDGDAFGEGEIFVDTDEIGPGSSIESKPHIVVMAKLEDLVNANPDANGSNVPTGISPFGQFRFQAADHNNTNNGLDEFVLDDIVLNVSASNVDMDAGKFRVYNKADSSRKAQCSALDPVTGDPLAGIVTGNIAVECIGLDDDLTASIDAGQSITLVLEGNIVNPQTGPTSSLQASLQNFNDADLANEFRVQKSHIAWLNVDSTSAIKLQWIEFPEPVVSSTTYQSSGGSTAAGSLDIAVKALSATDVAVENEDDINLLRFEALAGEDEDILFTRAIFGDGLNPRNLNNLENYALWVDTDQNGVVDTILEDGVAFDGLASIIFEDMAGGGYIVPAEQTYVFEVHADVNSSPETDAVQLVFGTASDNPYIEAEQLDNGDDLSGIETNGVCVASDCQISVTTVDSTEWELVSQGDLYVTKDTTPIRNRQLLGGTLSDPVLRIEFRAENEDIDVTDIRFDAGTPGDLAWESIDRLELFKSGEVQPFTLATRSGCAGTPTVEFCANMENRQLVISEGTDENILVRARVKKDTEGGVSGTEITLMVGPENDAILARGDVSSNDLLLNDQDALAEGEVFIGIDTPGFTQEIVSPPHQVVMSKIVSITNANPDTDGTAIPIGITPFTQFKFAAATHNNSNNGLNDVVLNRFIFDVTASNVEMDADTFAFYNKANSTVQQPCIARDPQGNELHGLVTGSLFVECSNIEGSAVNSEIDEGSDATFVLEGSITNAEVIGGEVSILQGNISLFSNFDLEDTFGNYLSHIEWIDQDASTNESHNWIEYPEPNVKSTTYRN